MSDQTEVVITLKDVFFEVQRLNALLTPLADPNTGVVSRQQDHEGRLRKLEAKVYAIPGIAVLLMAGGLAWSVFGQS